MSGRRGPVPAGLVRHVGRGLCQNCYAWARFHGVLVDYERLTLTREEVLEEYQWVRQVERTKSQCATRLGMTRTALDQVLVRTRRAERQRDDEKKAS